MNAKDYKAIGRIMSVVPNSGQKIQTVSSLADYFEKIQVKTFVFGTRKIFERNKFNRRKFFSLCGLEG